jgi:hypothetical protein
MRSLQYQIYKGKGAKFGAAQFNLAPSHMYCELCKAKNYNGETHPNTGNACSGKMISREGCVFLEITSPSAPDVYDWANKIIIALSVTDLGKLLVGLRAGTEVKLLHDPGAGSDKMGQIRKTLNFVSPNGLEQGGILTAGETSGDNKKQHKVPFTGDEVLVLAVLVQTAISRCMNWL